MMRNMNSREYCWGYLLERKHSKHAVAHLWNPSASRSTGSNRTHLSVTMSRTAPNLLVWFKALAAMPSKTSKMQLIKYTRVHSLGDFGMSANETAAVMTRM